MRLLDGKKLDRIARERRDEFLRAKPSPHLTFDDFLEPKDAEALLEEFRMPRDGAIFYRHYNNQTSSYNDLDGMGRLTRSLFSDLRSPECLRFLENLSGIEGLEHDPDLDGAGLHETRRDGYLNMHVDFLSHTTRTTWKRQLNMIIFLNKEWREEYHGYLELWDLAGNRRCAKIAPAFNRCLILRTDEKSFHGYPEPLRCPETVSRKSFSCYYYTDEKRFLRLTPTNYRPLPGDPLWKKCLITLDRFALRTYSLLKRHSILTDRTVSRLWMPRRPCSEK